MKVDIHNIKGKATGRSLDLPKEIFGAEVHDHSVWLAVKQFLAAQRQGTHKVKTRAEVQGSSRKLHRQKGTGGSRKGNIRNPLYKGGGAIFGPKPHKYALKVNRKVKDLAKIGALSSKAKDNKIWILEEEVMKMDAPATQKFLEVLNSLKTASRSILFVMAEPNENVYKSFRNIPNVCGCALSDLNTYDILNAGALVFTEEAAKLFTESPQLEEAEEA